MIGCKACTSSCSSKPTRFRSVGHGAHGVYSSGIRLPLTRLSEACQPVVEAAMRQAQAL